ncbi:hypothetical protein RND81_12G018800 [Saponaria officinalis]|uniref:VQ domain-containing protein n=1 Tax=Saponaria officinalis TaxID=3572 RepID=A0AAW1H746_SAPOF
MATSDNMGSIETWAFRPTFETSWFSEAFARDTEALTEALTQSLSYGSDERNVSISETPSMFPVQSVSSSGGSDPEVDPETVSVSKRPPRNGVVRKIAKRKSRASKRSTTTFITADPANFREMVQQVTGVGVGSSQILKPEPQRAGVGLGPGVVARLQGVGNGGYMLPTLDTSAFLLDHRQQVVGPGSVGGGAQGFGPSAGEVGGPGFDFDGFSCFPTLESWKVM